MAISKKQAERYARHFVPKKIGVPKNAATCAEAGILGTVPGILGCVQATEAIIKAESLNPP